MSPVNAQPAAEIVSIAGVELEVLRRGAGSPLLLLHGFQHIDPRLPIVELLARDAELIAPSHPGFGRSSRPADFGTVYDLVHLYLGLLDERVVARTQLFAIAADWASVGLWNVALSMADTNDDYDYAGELASSRRRLRRALDADDFGRQLQRARR